MSLVAFDFDGTLIDGDAGVLFARHLTGKRYLETLTQNPLRSARELTRLNFHTVRLLYRGLSIRLGYRMGEMDRHDVVEQAYQGFEGFDASWVSQELASYARKHLPKHLREGAVDQLRHHVETGDHVVVLSTGLHDLIWPLREVLGLDFEVVACRLRERDGELTGTVEGPMNGEEKATRLVAIAKRRGHDLEEAWAYGDHEDDRVLLEMVGNPVAVAPTRHMRRVARRKDWPILEG